jgi:hypothetical protein
MLSRDRFSLIEIKVQHLRDYVGKWLQFQSLWDLEADYVFNRFGEDLAHWQQLLAGIKIARSMFDTSKMRLECVRLITSGCRRG